MAKRCSTESRNFNWSKVSNEAVTQDKLEFLEVDQRQVAQQFYIYTQYVSTCRACKFEFQMTRSEMRWQHEKCTSRCPFPKTSDMFSLLAYRLQVKSQAVLECFAFEVIFWIISISSQSKTSGWCSSHVFQDIVGSHHPPCCISNFLAQPSLRICVCMLFCFICWFLNGRKHMIIAPTTERDGKYYVAQGSMLGHILRSSVSVKLGGLH